MNEPQQQRSRVTRQRLLDATIESLAEVGWSGTTVVGVAARAGVSRGAAQHHFTTRDDLVRAAVDRMTDELTQQMRMRGHELLDREDRPLAVLEMLTDLWSGTFGRAATHLWVAASTEPALQDLVLALEKRLNREVYRATLELLAADPSQPRVKESVRLTLDLTRGIGLGALLRPDAQRRKADLAQWAAVLASIPGIGSGFPV